MIRLSICIPAYNRAILLKETLESIIAQATDEVEITVSDNGSIDDTKAVVAHYQTLFPRIRYDRFPINQGPDKCYLRCIEIATGEYCWLMGSDDCLEEGAIDFILQTLKENPDLSGMSVNRSTYDATLSYQVMDTATASCANDKKISSFTDLFPFPAFYIGYMSGQVIKRAFWMDIVTTHPVEKFFNAYSLVYIIFHVVKKHPRWLYLVRKCVKARMENDSFLDKGAFRRLQIDVLGYSEILLTLFAPSDPVYQKTMDLVGKVCISGQLLRANLVPVEKGFWKKAFALCSRAYITRTVFWFRFLPLFVIPSFVWKTLRVIYRKTWKKYRLQRS